MAKVRAVSLIYLFMYNFKDSQLYGLQSIGDFFSILDIAPKCNIKYLCSDKLYRTVNIIGLKPCHVPYGILKDIHIKTKNILSEIILPDNVFSPAVKGQGKSAISHAKYHQYSKYLLAMDIKSFFENLKLKYIIKFFSNSLNIEYNTAVVISKILTFNGHIARGSCVSPILSHLSINNTFSKIQQYCKNRNLKLSIYMDDIIFSSDKKIDIAGIINFMTKVLSIIELKINYKKLRKYGINDNKRVTGVIITKDNKIRIQNKNRKKLKDIIENYNECDEATIKGLLSYMRQIEPKSYKKYNIIFGLE